MSLFRRQHRGTLAFVLAVLLLAAAVAAWLGSEPPAERSARLMTEARAQFRQRDFAGAEQSAAAVLAQDPQAIDAALLASDAAAEQGEYRRAARYVSGPLPRGDAAQRLQASLRAAELNRNRLHRLSEAERHYRAVLTIDPAHREANAGLAQLLALCGRRTEAIPHILQLVKQGEATDMLVLLAREDGVINDPQALDAARTAAPDDVNPLLGLAWSAASSEDTDRAITLLREAVQLAPNMPAPHAALGTQFMEARQFDELVDWNRSLPAAAEQFAEVWIVRGRMAEHDGQRLAAIRCYGEAAERSPETKFVNFRLAQLLAEDGPTGAAKAFAGRLERLQELERAQDRVLFTGQHDSIAPLLELIDRYEAAQRFWEAYGWSRLAIDVAPSDPSAIQRMERARTRVAGLPLRLCSASLPEGFQLASYPLPKFEQGKRTDSAEEDAGEPLSVVSFEDQAQAAGLVFRYNHGSEGPPTRRMFEFTGGGIGVLDADRDGYPDLFLTQGHLWNASASSIHDQLFRNLDGRRFESVATSAGLVEDGFGQGVTVGDFDADGFADLYVAQIGQNRLWRNNGDGTFSDVTDAAGIVSQEWTTSCLLADLNGDRWPDVYDVNYVTADDVFDRVCTHSDGSPKMCMPFDFDEQPDRVWLNGGDGTFREGTTELLGTTPGGKGLGIAAWNADGSGHLSVLVANDTTPSFFFTPVPSGDGLRLVENGIAAGLALNGEGKATGCMGIALGDIDGDQRFDVHITNFYAEPNTLFVSPEPELYVDRTRELGLRGPSLDLLGFGTQFLDADLDGDLELFTANGHIDDLSRFGKPYAMPAQLYELAGGQFRPIPAATLGPYFEKHWLGRAAARLDWNRDGREDLAVGHLAADSSLLTNTTPQTGRFLSLQLTGIDSNRDAVGTVVEARVGDQTYVRQITAGDGYQASNERRILFGVGDAEQIDELTVRWPSQVVQTFHDVATAQAFSLAEGRSLLILP